MEIFLSADCVPVETGVELVVPPQALSTMTSKVSRDRKGSMLDER
jgi:hypothetical protein